jgi:superfamily II DNA or RNA helicase
MMGTTKAERLGIRGRGDGVSDEGPTGGLGEQAVLPDIDPGPEEGESRDGADPDLWVERLRDALAERSPEIRGIAEKAVRACPADPELLLLAALAAMAASQPERALALLKRYQKRFAPGKPTVLLRALALAQQRQFDRAWTMLQADGLESYPAAARWFVGAGLMQDWLRDRLLEIRLQRMRAQSRSLIPTTPRPPKRTEILAPRVRPPVPLAIPAMPELPRLETDLTVRFEIADPEAIQLAGDATEPAWFRLRGELTRLSLFEGFDELLCLPALQGVETHWYQVETVRKVLKQYRGRVLLADEVGLGKTVEAGMVLKEYALRGMAERILILTPASLVGQWHDEMASKFGLTFATSHDPLLRADPGGFWSQPRVIASIAAARRKESAELLGSLHYDAVVVDEAHHLRDRASASYRLVNNLQKRFLLLLSATPVQNSLLELYNLLTLLKPGVFKTQKEFRSVYMVPGKPREPANGERLRELMRGAMVRNTRALAALRLPRRHASTLRATPDETERACYRDLTALVREVAAAGGQHRLAIQRLLAAAGSSPAAAAAAIDRFVERYPDDTRWNALGSRYRASGAGAKEAALLRLLAHNPAEKKMVFVLNRDSLTHLADRLRRQGTPIALFEGSMSGPEKDSAVDAFHNRVPLLLCSESGGEGRNLQFCNTMINFDIPWNPMAIEQRIGRIDRIGQTREVYVFNLATAGTIEDQVLHILDEKINMFELVVGEVGAILGEFEEQQDFSTLVLDAWLQGTDAARAAAFTQLEDQLLAARQQYEEVKALDEGLFGNELDAA